MRGKADMLDFNFEKTTLEDARKVLDGPAKRQSGPAPTKSRIPQAVETLSVATVRWLLDLPPACRPLQLARHYPRIANNLCRIWRQPGQWDRSATDLMIVSRGGVARQGFPAKVASELIALNEHHSLLYPLVTSVTADLDGLPWHCADMRRRD
jgi:hypothetical protein